MTLLFLALWMRVQQPPPISLHCVAEFGCARGERWGAGKPKFFDTIQGLDGGNRVLPWTSAELPCNSVDCDNADGNPKLCTVEPDEDEQ